jgi:hypothetical protein
LAKEETIAAAEKPLDLIQKFDWIGLNLSEFDWIGLKKIKKGPQNCVSTCKSMITDGGDVENQGANLRKSLISNIDRASG